MPNSFIHDKILLSDVNAGFYPPFRPSATFPRRRGRDLSAPSDVNTVFVIVQAGSFLSCTKAKFRNEGEKVAHLVALHRCLRRSVVMIF